MTIVALCRKVRDVIADLRGRGQARILDFVSTNHADRYEYILDILVRFCEVTTTDCSLFLSASCSAWIEADAGLPPMSATWASAAGASVAQMSMLPVDTFPASVMADLPNADD